jgi:O-antigen ligase/polysaccharide polymerase Wzy-like membrane protein
MTPVSAAGISTSASAGIARPEDFVTRRVVLLMALHVPLGLVMHFVPAVATGHAVLTVMVATFLALTRPLDRVVYAAAYIAGSEVLWRMSRATIFWESGKYAVILIFAIALLRLQSVRPRALPTLYFLLLLPSIALAPYDLLSDLARQQISFNLSGPAALAMSVFFLSQIRLGRREWLNTVIALTGPLMAIVTVAVYNTIAAPRLTFTLESNDVTSGGFGPNQVSTALGLGALLAFFIAIEPGRRIVFRWTMLGIALVFATQSAMTFSRGGLYSAGVAIIAGAWYLLREPRARVALLLAAGALSAMAVFVILPRLERFTGGTLGSRFEDVNTTGRDEMAREDLRVFLAHPVGGLGPGGGYISYARRAPNARREPAHTELTRLPAEHGLLGVGALLLLLAMALQGLKAARSVQEKALVAALLIWSISSMLHAAMRTVAPSLVFGLAFAIPASRPSRPATPVRITS